MVECFSRASVVVVDVLCVCVFFFFFSLLVRCVMLFFVLVGLCGLVN